MSLELLDVRLHADDKLSLRWPLTRFVYWLTLDKVSAASGAPLQNMAVHVKQYPDSLLVLVQQWSQMSSNSRQTFHDSIMTMKSTFYIVDCTYFARQRHPKASCVCCFIHTHQAAVQMSSQTVSERQLTYDWSSCSAYHYHLLKCCYD